MSPGGPSDRLDRLAEGYWRFRCHEEPLYAVLAGEDTPDAVLFREAPEDHDRRDEVAGELLSALEDVDPSALGPQDRATHGLLRHELDRIRRLYAVGAHLRPSLFPTGPGMLTAYYANTVSIEDATSAERYVDRLATIPSYLDDLAATLRAGHSDGIRYPSVALHCAARSLRAAAPDVDPAAFLGPFARSTVSGRPAVERQRERASKLIGEQLAPAFERLAGLLEGPLARDARSEPGCAAAASGIEYYREMVRDFTTTEMEPDEVHELGLAEVARLETEMGKVAADAGFGDDLGGYRAFLSGDDFVAESGDALRDRFQILCKRIDRLIPSYFGRIPRMTYGVESMPEAVAERMPLAYAQPNPGDRSSSGVFWITSLPRKCPAPVHVPTALHEAWPGHLMHIALMQEADHLPSFRRHGATRYPACIEGWAIYCEDLGVDMGLYETPHQHYGRLEMEMWRALRLVVDTGIHWHGWSRDHAVDTMARSMAMSRPALEDEVDRYISWPGQALAYQIGHLEIRRLRELAEARLGPQFRLRAFHDTVLSAGAVSLPVLRTLVEDWVGDLDRVTMGEETGDAHA